MAAVNFDVVAGTAAVLALFCAHELKLLAAARWRWFLSLSKVLVPLKPSKVARIAEDTRLLSNRLHHLSVLHL